MRTQGAIRRVDWGHLALLFLLAAATGWYLFDAWAASPRPRNLILILPASLLAFALVLVVAGGVFIRAATRTDESTDAHAEGGAPEPERQSLQSRLSPFILMGLFALYILTLPVFGFDLGSALFVAMALIAQGDRRPLFVASYAIGFAAAATLIFGWLLPYPMHTLIL